MGSEPLVSPQGIKPGTCLLQGSERLRHTHRGRDKLANLVVPTETRLLQSRDLGLESW